MSRLGTTEQDASQPGHLSHHVTPQLCSSGRNLMHIHSPPLHRKQSEIVTNTTQSYAETITVEHSADTLKDKHDSENDEFNKGTDLNDNLPPKPSFNLQTKSATSTGASDPFSPHSDSNNSTASQIALTVGVTNS